LGNFERIRVPCPAASMTTLISTVCKSSKRQQTPVTLYP